MKKLNNNMDYFIHPSAIVDHGAQIGENSKIWHFSHISSEAKIGTNVSIGQNVYVANNSKIGNNCKIQNNVSIYESVILEDNVFCGPSVVFTNVYNPRSEYPRKNNYKNTLIKKGVTLGANSTIVCGVTINDYAFIGAGTLINKDIKPFALMVGVPGYQIGWMSKYGLKIPLPLEGKGEYICPNTKNIYVLDEDTMYLK